MIKVIFYLLEVLYFHVYIFTCIATYTRRRIFSTGGWWGTSCGSRIEGRQLWQGDH